MLIISSIVALFCRCQSDKPVVIDLGYKPDRVELFAPGFINTNLYKRDIAITAGGDEIIFTLSDYKKSRRCLVSV
jgi:hypothetical protein